MIHQPKCYFIGPALRREREAKNLFQLDLAPLLGGSQSYISLIESNRQAVDRDFIDLCAEKLGTTPERLIEPETPTIIIENQTGSANGTHNVVNNHSDGEVEALKDLVAVLKNQVADLKAQIKAKE